MSWPLWSYGKYVSFNSVTGIDFEPQVVLNFLLLVVLMVLGYILFAKNHWALTISVIVGTLFLFFLGFTKLNLLGVLIFLLLNIYSSARLGRRLKATLKPDIPDMLNHSLMPVILGMFVMISFAAYQSSLANEIKQTDRLPNQTAVFFREVVETIIGPKIETSNSNEKQNIINQITSQTFQEFNGFLRPYFQYAPPLLAFALFLVLWGLSWLFVWIGVGLGVFIFWILKKTKVVRIEERDVKAEVLVV